MPYKENMIKNKRSVTVIAEALGTLVIAVILFLVVSKFGGKAYAAIFGGKDLQDFEEFVKQLNNIDVSSRKILVSLNTNTALIGFSSKTDSFKCFACGSSGTDITSYFNKPENEQCNNKPCVCFCQKSLKIGKSSPYEMKCDNMPCITLNKDLVDVIELGKYIEQFEKIELGKYSPFKNAKWTGGFLLEKHSRGDFVSNGLPQLQGNKFTVFVKKETVNNIDYVAVCPGQECIVSVQASQQKYPTNICQIMYDCFGTDIRRVPGFPDSYCRFDRPATRQNTLEDCEKVRECTNKKTSAPSKCIKAGISYELTFAQDATTNNIK